ncbi:hypothetical protein HJC23_005060 [Cyclotella cryptica]|uniref:Uncharacterized protein n=1 Tax=Cyclotella cryptica TaxID=29204 RepID=A0ABD3QEA6_9STRA|eukprot:CCRYP_006283-RA/>CCRYP_006283-RA protein AED:0.38 eAED:0.38 QI:320/1/1/1/1/1/3/1096/625
MRAIASAVYHAAVILIALGADAGVGQKKFPKELNANSQPAVSQSQDVRRTTKKDPENDRMIVFPTRKLQDVLRYVPIKLGISMETSKSGDIDSDELGGIVGGHILTYLQQSLTDYEAVAVETEIAAVSEPFRRREMTEEQPKIRQVRATGYVYFAGDYLPTSEYLNGLIENAFEGDEIEVFLGRLEKAYDPVIRSTTQVWDGLTANHEEYLPANTTSSDSGNLLSNNIFVIGLGLAGGVALVALFGVLRYRKDKDDDDGDSASLTDIPWLSVQVPKVAPKRSFDLQSTMEAPIEAVAGETKSVIIAVGEDRPEKVALRDDISVIMNLPKLPLATEDKTEILTKLYERSLGEDGIIHHKSVSFEDETFEDNSSKITTKREVEGMTSRSIAESSQGKEIQINEVFSDEQSKRSSSSSASKKFSLRKKVTFPAWTSKSQSRSHAQNDRLEVIEEGEEISLSKDGLGPEVLLAQSGSEEREECQKTNYEMASQIPVARGGIFATISHESGIKEAWENISRKYSLDPNWDANTSVSSRDFENTSFQCGLGPACVSTMTESEVAVNQDDDEEDDGDDSDEMTEYTSSEYMSQYTSSEYMSQYTNPSTNASLSTESYSCESASTFSDDGSSR